MTHFQLPLTIATADGEIDLLITVGGPATLGQALPELLCTAGLPAGTQLFHGVGSVEPSWVLGRPPLLAGTVLTTEPADAVPVQAPVTLSCVAGPDAGRWAPLTEDGVLVGRSPDAGLQLDDPALSREHAVVTADGARLLVTDRGSANGLRLDGTGDCVIRQVAGAGTLIRTGGSLLRVGLTAEPPLLLTPDGCGGLRVARPARLRPPFRHPLPAPPDPPPERIRRPIPLLAAAIGAMLGVAIALATRMWMFLLLAALGPLMMVGTALGDRVTGRRGHRRASADHRATLAQEERLLAVAAAADRLDAWDRYPDPATLLRRAVHRAARLWERRPGEPDFLRLTIGVGARPARVDRADPPQVDEVPLTIELTRIGVLGLTGQCRPLLRALIGSAACLHAPSELRIVVLSREPDLLVLRDLEHLAQPGAPGRVTRTDEEGEQVTRELLAQLADDGPAVLLVLDAAQRWRQLPGARDLLRAAARPAHPAAGLIDEPGGGPGGRLAAICVADTAAALPVECRAVATVTPGELVVTSGAVTLRAEPVGVDQDYLRSVVGALAGLRDPDHPDGQLPVTVRLTELRESAGRPDWRSPALRTVLGCSASGPVDFDLERDGPHLLIAGTTGSGKSELLQTLVVGLALAAPPAHTSFLLIDYKGGAAFAGLAELPHAAGLVTDLDEQLATRALTSLRAEVRRRERILTEAGVADLATLRAAGPAEIGSLVIVVDEFATLAAELPEFLSGLLDVAQRGRSLGLHLVLATQRPSGVLSPAIKANITARICLRVADSADSIDVVDVPAAARLPSGVPGRALLRTEGPALLFQTAVVTQGPRPLLTIARRDDGGGHPPGGGEPDLPALVLACQRAAAGLDDGGDAPPVWLPPLPEVITADELPQVVPGCPTADVLAVIDRPAHAARVTLSATAGSTLIAGVPGSGRTTALRRIGTVAARGGAELIVVDSGGVLADLSDWPVTGSYLDGADPVLVQRLIKLLHGELIARAGRPGPPIQLLIDGWEAITAPLDLLDYGEGMAQLAELAGRGPAVGISVAATGDLRFRHHRYAPSFATTLVLGTDPQDLGPGARAAGGPPVPGRGHLAGDLLQIIDAPTGQWTPGRTGPTPQWIVRSLPEAFAASRLPPPTPALVPVGIGGDAAVPVGFDLTGPGGGLLITGPRRSGVTTALRVLAEGASAAGIRVLRTRRRPDPPLPGMTDVLIRAGPEPLRELLIAHDGPLLLVAEDVEPEDPVSELLERFLTAAGPGQHLALGCRLDRALRAHRGLIPEVAAFRTGILLHADSADGAVLDVRLPRRRSLPGAGRGHLVRSGEVMQLQVASAGPIAGVAT